MLMVGLWAGIAFPRFWWVCPAAFISFMLGGFAHGAAGGAFPIAEMLILASLVGLALALLADARPPLALSAAVIALFAIGHGFAHGSEMGAGARSEEHTSELQSLTRNSYAVFCSKKQTSTTIIIPDHSDF